MGTGCKNFERTSSEIGRNWTMKLKKTQREALLAWVAEGLQTDEINKRAALFASPFEVTRQQVDFYRKTRKVDIEQLRKEGEFTALNTGLSVKEKRVDLLHQLAEKMRQDLLENNLLWVPQVKGIGGADNFERVDYEEFNAAEVMQLRGVLDDIAAELNERMKKLEHSGPGGGAIPIFDMDAWKKDREKRIEKVEKLEE
jgi:hypothetical protein